MMYLRCNLKVALFLVAVCVHCSFTDCRSDIHGNREPPEEVIDSTSQERIRGLRDTRNKDFILGGLFPIHNPAPGGQTCGELRKQGGIDRVEAMLYAIDRINSDSWLLPNITLGYDIRDTCYVEQIGLDEAADIIITGSHKEIQSQCNMMGSNTTIRAPTIGIVGAGSSAVTIPIAGLSRLFSVPQVSYSSSSVILNNRERYTYFYRTVPADNMEAKAIIDLLRYFKWTQISVVYSRDGYGQSGFDDLNAHAAEYNICVDLKEGIEEYFEQAQYDELAEKLVNNSKANVVVLYGSRGNAEILLPSVARYQAKSSSQRTLTWIATGAWVQAVESIRKLKEINSYIAAVGLFGTVPLFTNVNDFDHYYLNLTIDNNQRNPWFPEYYAALTNCMLSVNCNNNASISNEQETIFEQEYAIPLTIDATYTFAQALHNYLVENCNETIAWDVESQTCAGQKQPLNGSILLEYIRNISFESPTGNNIVFDNYGNIKARYSIMNFQTMVTDQPNAVKYNLEPIGIWDSVCGNRTNVDALQLNNNEQFHFGIDASGNVITRPSESHCGTCSPGKYKRAVGSCCGLCESCFGQNYSNTSTAIECMDCMSLGDKWGDNPTQGSTKCVDIPTVFLKFTNPWSNILMISLIVGMIGVVAVGIIFAMYWKTPAIISSSPELMVLILLGVFLSFGVAVFYISPPSVPICALQRISIWLSYSLMFGCITVKITRIARIFIIQKSGFTRLRCMKSYHQVIITFLVVLGQLAIVFISLLVQYPLVKRELRLNAEDHNKLPEIVVTCEPDPLVLLLISVVYETGLIVVSLVLGTLSFKYPANFNEAKSICCATFALLIIWIAFFPTYIATQNKQELQNAAIATAVVLNAYVVLVCLFGPRVFIVLFWKERNSKWYSRRKTEDAGWENSNVTAEFHSNYKVSKDEEPKQDSNSSDEQNNQVSQEDATNATGTIMYVCMYAII